MCVLPVLLAFLVAGALASQSAPVVVTADARSLQPGELVVLTVTTARPVDSVSVRAFGRALSPFQVDDTTWRVLVGIDLDVKPGPHVVTVGAGTAPVVTHRLAVAPKAFPTRRLKVDPNFVNPPATVLARIEEESRELAELWASSARARLWSDPFVRPVPQPANSAFGTRSVLNGETRSPHGGADFASPTGTPVQSPGGGRVVLAKSLYYTGHTVVIDHGLGLISLFAHLSEIDVQTGDTVNAGSTVGRVGATGRVTGPHLHWTVRAGGARIDPLSLLALLGAN
jgi:murein DD-endopeptidase MepM/ murein hydrolase activator NlpD